MRWRYAWLGLAVLAGCASSLPSSTPLGSGPLAERSDDSTAAAEPRAPAARAERAKQAPRRAPAPAGAHREASAPGDAAPPSDAGAEAGPVEAAAPSVVFAGSYSGVDTVTVTMAGVDIPSVSDPNAKLDVVLRPDGSLGFRMIDNSGNTVCAFAGHANGSVVTLDAGQTCVKKHATITLTSGSATVAGKRLVFDAALDLRLLGPNRDMSGTMKHHFEGSRP
jgi:hypothetical protein